MPPGLQRAAGACGGQRITPVLGLLHGGGKKHRAPLPAGVPTGQIGALGTRYHFTQYMDKTRFPREGTSGNRVWGVVSPTPAVYSLLPSLARYGADRGGGYAARWHPHIVDHCAGNSPLPPSCVLRGATFRGASDRLPERQRCFVSQGDRSRLRRHVYSGKPDRELSARCGGRYHSDRSPMRSHDLSSNE